MSIFSPARKIKYLLLFLLLFSTILPVHSGSLARFSGFTIQVKDTAKAKKDSPKVQLKDTSKTQVTDSSKSLVKNAGQLQIKDSSKFQGKDTTKLKSKDSTATAQDTEKKELPDSVIY